MTIVIVPNVLRDKIRRRILEAIKGTELWCERRQVIRVLYPQLLEYFDEHGTIPDFQVARK